jgi:hypothetical protein
MVDIRTSGGGSNTDTTSYRVLISCMKQHFLKNTQILNLFLYNIKQQNDGCLQCYLVLGLKTVTLDAGTRHVEFSMKRNHKHVAVK